MPARQESDLEIREMHQNETEKVYFLYKSNSVVSLRNGDIEKLYRDNPEQILVAVRKEVYVVGACFVLPLDQNVGLISGFVVSVTEGNYIAVQKAMLESAKRRLPNRRIELIVPRSMRNELYPLYQRHSDIYLYVADICEITLPNCCTSDYTITMTKNSYTVPTPILLFTTEDVKVEPSFHRTCLPPIATFEISDEQFQIGYGMLNKNNEREWIIGPFFAPDEKSAKVLLSTMLSYIKYKEKNGLIYMYVIANSTISRFLRDFGFDCLFSEWSRYSCLNTHKFQPYSWANLMKDNTNALMSIIFSVS